MEQDYEEVVRLLENELAEVRVQASKALVLLLDDIEAKYFFKVGMKWMSYVQ